MAEVPDSDHVSRYCRPTDFDGGELQGSAFILRRAKQETSLSVNWLEHLSAGRDDQIGKLRNVFAAKFQVAATAQFAVLNVGISRTLVKEATGLAITVRHEPMPDDMSHAEIDGILRDDELVAETLVKAAIQPLYPARIPKKP